MSPVRLSVWMEDFRRIKEFDSGTNHRRSFQDSSASFRASRITLLQSPSSNVSIDAQHLNTRPAGANTLACPSLTRVSTRFSVSFTTRVPIDLSLHAMYVFRTRKHGNPIIVPGCTSPASINSSEILSNRFSLPSTIHKIIETQDEFQSW